MAGLLQKVHTIPVSFLQIISRFDWRFTHMEQETWEEIKMRIYKLLYRSNVIGYPLAVPSKISCISIITNFMMNSFICF